MNIKKIISLFFVTVFTINFSISSIYAYDDVYSKEYIINAEAEFAMNDYMGSGIDDFKYEIGNIPIVISAPHTVKQLREGQYKEADTYTGALIKALGETTGAHIIYKTSTNGDENYTLEETEYRRTLSKIIDDNKVRIVFDLHGMTLDRLSDIDIGTGSTSHKNLLKQSYILSTMENSLFNSNYSINQYFSGGGAYTSSTYVSQKLGIPGVQLEINKKFRDKNSENFTSMVNTLTEMINDIYDECYKVKVEHLETSEATTSSIKLSWDKVPGISQYEVHASTSKNGTYTNLKTTKDTTYTHTQLKAGQTYYYKIKSVDGEMSSIFTSSTLCDAPKAKTEANESKSIKVSWNKVTGASGYEILRATSKDGKYYSVGKVTSGNTLSYTNTNLTTGKTYYYKVRAYKTVNEIDIPGKDSSIVSSTSKLSTPKVNLTAKERQIYIKWDKVTDASGYEVYSATSKNGKYTNIKTITSSNTVNYTNTNLTAGKTYYYKVRPYKNISGEKVYGGYSSIISTTPKLPTPSVTLSAASKKIYVKWKKITDANGYEIYRSTSKNGKYSKVKTITKGSTISYTNSSLGSKKTYYYKVRSYKTVSGKKIYSSYSSIKNIKTK